MISLNFKRHLLKLIALFFSLTLWFYVLNSEKIEFTFKTKVKYLIDESVVFENPPIEEVEITVKGPQTFIRSLKDNSNLVFVDLIKQNIKTNKNHTIIFRDSNISVPFAVEIKKIVPSKATIKLVPGIKKTIQIKPHFVGAIGKDLKMIKWEIRPNEIEVVGPEKQIQKIESVLTRPIDLSTLNDSGMIQASIIDLHKSISYDSSTPFEFSYIIKPTKANQSLKNLRIRFVSSAVRFETKTKFVSIDVLTSENRVIKASEVHVVADIPESLKLGTHKIDLKVRLPDDIHVLRVYPESIMVNIY